MEVSGQLQVPAALPLGKEPGYPLDRRLGGPQGRSGRGGEEKNSKPLPTCNLCSSFKASGHTLAPHKTPGNFFLYIALGYGLDDRGFESRQGLGIFLFTTASRPTLGPTQPPIQWVPGALSLGKEWSGREADHLPPSSAEVTNAWSYTSTPPIRLHGVLLSWSTETPLPLYPDLQSFGKYTCWQILNWRTANIGRMNSSLNTIVSMVSIC
jgi:hypothetical protein